MFYLKLVPSINYTGSDFGKGESWEEVVGTSQQRDGNCTDDKSVSCSCGRLLSEDQGVVEDRLKATCAQYENIEDQSDFSFCTESLERAGFEITKESVDVAIPMVYTFNESMLNALLRDMEDQLRIFKMVLDRTVSGILAESNTAKCFCFVSVCECDREEGREGGRRRRRKRRRRRECRREGGRERRRE